jgi:hypothetical protein
VPALIEPIARGVADVTFGSCLSGGKPQRAHLFWHFVGNRFLSLLAKVLFNTQRSPTWRRGTKRSARTFSEHSTFRSDDFAIEAEITAKVCKRKLRIYELPIAYYGRTYAEGKKITWRDGVKAIWVLLKFRVSD